MKSGNGRHEVSRELALLRQDLVNEIEAETGVSLADEVSGPQAADEAWASLTEQFGSRSEAERQVGRLIDRAAAIQPR